MVERKDRLERVGRLVAYLLNHAHPVDRPELEKAVPEYAGENGRRLFESDKATLRRAGIVVRVVEVDGVVVGYELRPRDYELPPIDLTDDEQLAVALAIRSVDFSAAPWTRLAGTKLGIDDTPPMAVLAELPGLDLLPELQDAAARRCRIRFGYKGESRDMDPWGVVLKHGRWYVPGFDHARADVRVFRIDRIDPGSLTVGEPDAFAVSVDVSARDLVPDDALVIDAGERRSARVRVDRRIAGLLRPADPACTTAEGDEVVLDIEVSNDAAFVSWVLGLGELAVVEGPPDLRAAVIRRLEELAI